MKNYLPLLLIAVGCSSETVSTRVQPPPLAINANRPALELLSGDGQLGSADFGEARSCDFRIRNNQSQPITLKLLDKSCTCAGVQLATGTLASGQEATITMNWLPKVEALESSLVRLWAEVGDGSQKLRLEATGTIEPKLCIAFPRGPLDLGKISLSDLDSDRHTLVAEIYARHQSFAEPKVTSSIPGIIHTAEPMTPDRLTTLQAKAGYRLTLKPTKNLPHGAFQGQLAIQTEIKSQPLLLDVSGHLETAAISLSQEKLQLPPKLALSSNYRLPALTLTIRYGSAQQCQIESTSPDLFDAKLSKLKENTWKLDVSLRSNLEKTLTPKRLQHLLDFGLDQGSVVIKLDHPDVKLLTIPITGCQFFKE